MNLRTSRSDEYSNVAPVDYRQLFRDLPLSQLLIQADDPHFTIVDMNHARERLLGMRREDCLGRPLLEVLHRNTEYCHQAGEERALKQIRKAIRTRHPQMLETFPYTLPEEGEEGPTHYWRSVYTPLRLGTDGVTHVLVTTEDVTQEQTAERRRESAEARLDAALNIGRVGSWAWDLDARTVTIDENLAPIFGMSKKQVRGGVPQETFLNALHPDDRKRVERAAGRSIRRGIKYEEEYRTVGARGKVRWVLARGKVQLQDGVRVFTGVTVDITERRDLQAQIDLARQQDRLNRQAARVLQARNEELEALSRTKDEFVALASHQLRTPATAVKQYLGMVLQGYVGEISDLQANMLAKAFESNERQINIINQILNAARVDTGRLVMNQLPLDLRALVEGVTTDMGPFIRQRKHNLQVTLPQRPVMIAGDLGYLRMAIENIINNAAIYTPDGGSITVRLTKAGRYCQLSIHDTGVGIRKADLPKLFVKFSRIHNPLSVQAGGSGIGLYLTNEIIRQHKGRINVTSKVGKGTTFAISLPLVQNESEKVEEAVATIPKLKSTHKLSENMRTGLQT